MAFVNTLTFCLIIGQKNEENRPEEADDDFNQPIARLFVVIDQSVYIPRKFKSTSKDRLD